MAFKYDRQHLTGQQQAIATQRDRTDEELRKNSSKKEEVKQIIKIETFKKFIGKDQIFDLVITKHEHEGSFYGNHNSEVVNIKDEQLIIDGVGFTGSIMEKLVSEVNAKNAKISFFDTDGLEIKLSIIKRYT